MANGRSRRLDDHDKTNDTEVPQSSAGNYSGKNESTLPPCQLRGIHEHIKEDQIQTKDSAVDRGKGLEPQKPWKQKKKTWQGGCATDRIEIFEGKGVVSGASQLAITSPADGYLQIICKDDCEFLVPAKVVECFQCVDVILHTDAVFKENLENVIRFPDISPEIMEYVLRFAFIEHLNKLKAAQYWGAKSPRLVFQFEVDPRQVMDLIYVAHFLGIDDLLIVAATMVARHLQDLPDVSSIPVDLAHCVAEQFSPQELYDAEERPDFLSLGLETDSLWERHCKKFLREDIVRPTGFVDSPPSYDTWGFFEGPPPATWKALFSSLNLQQLADRQDGSRNESFFAEIKSTGMWAHSHTVRPMFYEWVLSTPESLSLLSYAAQFPNLLSLHLVKLPLGVALQKGTVPCLVVGEILKCHPLLELLDLSETGFTAEAAILLSQSLQSHPRIQALRLAFNNMGTDGFTAIARALPYVRTLKLLDVRENGISSFMTEDAVAGLQVSALEEFLFGGNFAAQGAGDFDRDGEIRDSTSVLRGFQANSFTIRASTPVLQGAQEYASPEPKLPQTPETQFTKPVSVFGSIPHTLKGLQVQQCDLVDSDISSIVDALSQHTFIQKVDLSDNLITAIGAISIFKWLQGNDSLLELHLSNNKITDACSDVLLQALHSHTRLQKLSLRGNFSYGEARLFEVIDAGVARGQALLSTSGSRFVLDLRMTMDISFTVRARIQRRSPEWSGQLHLMI